MASNINFIRGETKIKAYLRHPIDGNKTNDSAELVFKIDPKISITAQSITGKVNCLPKGLPAQQEITITNTGNYDIPAIELIMNVSSVAMPTQTFQIPLPVGVLQVDSSVQITFNDYIVPADPNYAVEIIAYMTCDSLTVHDIVNFNECADMFDLEVATITEPNGVKDTVGTLQEITVLLKNRSDMYPFANVDIIARIEDTTGAHIASIPVINDNIDRILDSDTAFFHTFNGKYTVPSNNKYVIRVYVNSMDNYPENDTATLLRETAPAKVGVKTIASFDFVLEQNIPNPADKATSIEYFIPESGEVVFNIHTVSGQLLYNEVIQSESGKQTIELNTEDFAAGVYLYSLEYKGQKLIKRMSVKK